MGFNSSQYIQEGQVVSAHYIALLRVVFCIVFNVITISSAVCENSPPTGGNGIDFQQISPAARKLIVEEIRLQLQSEINRDHNELVQSLFTWIKFGGGIAAIVVAVCAFLGWKSLGDLRERIKNDLENFIKSDSGFRRDLSRELEDLMQGRILTGLERIRREVKLERLQLVSQKVAAADQFSDTERYAMIELLESAADDPDIKSSAEFKDAAVLVLRSLSAARLDGDMDRLDSKLRDVFVASSPISSTLMRHYGPRMQEVEMPPPSLVEQFYAYVAACRQNKDPEVALPYLLTIEFREKTETAKRRIDTYLDEIRFLKVDERQYILEFFHESMALDPSKVESFRDERARVLEVGFFSEYGKRLEQLCSSSSENIEEKDEAR